MAQGMVANASNTFQDTIKLRGVPVNTMTLTLLVKDPSGLVVLNNVAVPYVAASAGIYQYPAAPTVLTIPGTYTAIWNGVDSVSGKTYHKQELFTVTL